MKRQLRILLQTTIPTVADDWSVSRFSRLAEVLREQCDEERALLFDVTARDRDPLGAPDAVLASLDTSDFDELWLFAVDTGDGLGAEECAAISRFRRQGGGLMVARDHMDLGISICPLGGVGKANYFHTKNLDPDANLNRIDDPYTTRISWPNYHSGANGDFQTIEVMQPVHPTLINPLSTTGAIRFLPSHPHEGAVGAPPDDTSARVIARGRSKISGAHFNIAVAFERSANAGPAIAQSSFHHFTDYNWDSAAGCPSTSS